MQLLPMLGMGGSVVFFFMPADIRSCGSWAW